MLTKGRAIRSSRNHSSRKRAAFAGLWQEDPRFRVLAGWLIFVFLLGGSSRADVASLQLIRPISLFVLAYGLAQLSLEDIRRHRLLLGCAAAWFGLLIVQLVPLPPAAWQTLGGRDIVRSIDEAAGLGDVWRPLSMVPFATWNALWASLTPAAALVLGAGLRREDLARLVPLLIGLALLSLFLAALQILGDPEGPLYFYSSTHNGLPVGLLANRNNQALLLATAIPMLAAWAATTTQDRKSASRAWLAALGGIVLLIPMILMTGSRTGSLLGLLGLLSLPLFLSGHWKSPADGKSGTRKFALGVSAAALVAIIALTVAFGRALSVNRIMAVNAAEDARISVLPTLFRMIETHFPWGVGIGGFYPVFRMNEPDRMLGPVYMNQAHNDWLDLALTGGMPVLILLVVLLAGVALRLPAAFRSHSSPDAARLVRLGFLIVLMLALASITEYPLRVPSLACLGAVGLLWINSFLVQDGNKDFAGAKV